MNIYVIFILAIVLALVASKRDNFIYVFLLIIIISLFIGLRDKTIGDDTETYYSMFLYLKNGTFSPNYEYGFSLISYIILKIFKDIQAPFIVFALFTNTLIVRRLWEIRNQYSFTLMLLLYLVFYYPSSCNIMRQYIAIAIVFWGLRFLEKDRTIIFVGLIIIATTIHNSAAVSILYVLIYELNTKRHNPIKTRTYAMMYILCIPILAIAVAYFMRGYGLYFTIRNSSLGLFNFVRLFLVLVSVILSPYLFKKFNTIVFEIRKKKEVNTLEVARNRIILITYVMGIILYFLGYYKTTIMRIGLYFGFSEILFIPIVTKNGRGRQIAAFLYSIMFLYYFLVNAQTGWSELGNYISILN